MSAPPADPHGKSHAPAPGVAVPPIQPTLHHHLAVHLAPEGLVLRPHATDDKQQHRRQAVRVPWGSAEPAACEWGDDGTSSEGDSLVLVVDGVAGLLVGFSDKYLVAITQSAAVATLPDPQHTTVRTTRSLLAIPLSSLEAARAVVAKHLAKQASRRKRSASVASTLSALTRRAGGSLAASTDQGDSATPAAESTDESDVDTADEADEVDPAPVEVPPAAEQQSQQQKRPFWQRALSRSKISPAAAPAVADFAQAEGTSASAADKSSSPAAADPNEAAPADAADAPALPDLAATATATPSSATDKAGAPADKEVLASHRELDRKLVAEVIRTFTGLYFSRSGDITRSLQARHESGSENDKPQPLWRLADRRYWFNRHLMKPFVQAGLHDYIIVLMQGFCEEITVPLPIQPYRTLSDREADPASPTSIDLDLIIISRRSTERPGLRYQRRGVNDAGEVANFVETEFIVLCVREGAKHTCSFVQTRGSMPLFWSQSPYALKPPPVLERTKEESRAAMRRHFDGLLERYGPVTVIQLAETDGKEGVVVRAYREGVASLGLKDVRYLDWDFHKATRGFHYENLSQLIDLVADDLENFSTFWATPSSVYSTQRGVPRVGCVDCIDRSSVGQAAVSRWVLRRHLVHLGLTSGEEAGMHDDLDLAFNTLWADNGDAISRQYAGSSALKGDYTRTGVRNWKGAVNDASNSAARLVQGAVTDFFKQAALDYMLGVNVRAFEEFSARLETSDPSEILRLGKIRQEAIETSCREVLSEGELKVDAWTLLSPSPGDSIVRPPARAGKYEEKVLVLSTRAVHVVSYEYTLQKVSSSVRIPLGSIQGVQTGAYILSSLDAAARDPTENYGFLLRFADEDATEQMRTYSLRTTPPRRKSSSTSSSTAASGLKPLKLAAGAPPSSSASSSTPETHYLAFKALRRDAVKIPGAGPDGASQIIDSTVADQTARDLVRSIVGRIRAACERVRHGGEGEGAWKEEEEEKDIISVAESRASTSIVDKLTHSLARAVWA
ncbi:hypothetical protein JCM9279_004558 [Rhodotorula babjevae]